MSVKNQNMPLATSAAAAPGLLTQVGMAGTSAVITVRGNNTSLPMIDDRSSSECFSRMSLDTN